MVTDRLEMTLAVDWAVKPQHKQTNILSLLLIQVGQLSVSVKVWALGTG